MRSTAQVRMVETTFFEEGGGVTGVMLFRACIAVMVVEWMEVRLQ